MSTKAVLSVKVDAKLKKEVQKLASSLGLSVSGLVSSLLEEFTQKQTASEKELVPNKKTQKIIEEAERELKEGKVKSFSSMEEFIEDLMS